MLFSRANTEALVGATNKRQNALAGQIMALCLGGAIRACLDARTLSVAACAA